MLEIGSLMEMLKDEFVAIFEITIFDADNRLTKVSELRKKLRLYLAKLSITDHVFVGPTVEVIEKELVLMAEVFV